MKPSRGLLQVRPIDTDETLPGGRIALVAETRERMTAWQCEVIAVGEPAICEDEDCDRAHAELELACSRCGNRDAWKMSAPPVCVTCGHHVTEREFHLWRTWPIDGGEPRTHPCRVVLGDWLLVRPRSYIAGPDTTKAEWFVHQDDVLAILSED